MTLHYFGLYFLPADNIIPRFRTFGTSGTGASTKVYKLVRKEGERMNHNLFQFTRPTMEIQG